VTDPEVVYPRFRWFVAAAFIVATMTQAFALISMTPLMGDIAKSIGRSVGETVMIVMPTFIMVVSVGAIVGGAIIDKIGIVKTWYGCLVLLALGFLFMPVVGADSAEGMIAIRILQGAGAGPIMGCSAAVAALWFPPHERGILTGLQGLAMGAGVALGTIIGPTFAQLAGGWQYGMALQAVFCVIAFIMAYFVSRGPQPPAIEMTTSDAEGSLSPVSELKALAFQTATLGVVVTSFTASWVFQALSDLTPSFLAIDPPVGLGYGPVVGGSLFSFFSLSFMVGAVAGAIITEKLFGGYCRIPLAIAFAVSSVTAFLLKSDAVTSRTSTLVVDLAICGFFLSQIQPQGLAFVAKWYPTHLTGRLGATVLGLSGFGSTIGVTVGAYALHVTGFYYRSITIVLIVCLVGIVGSLLMNPPKIHGALRESEKPQPELKKDATRALV